MFPDKGDQSCEAIVARERVYLSVGVTSGEGVQEVPPAR